jgi:hypothetical protein
MVYVSDAEAAGKTLGLVATEAGANVWLLEPYDKVVFERTQTIPVASGKPAIGSALSQVATDLLTSPGRGPQEAQALMDYMKGHENEWRKLLRS